MMKLFILLSLGGLNVAGLRLESKTHLDNREQVDNQEKLEVEKKEQNEEQLENEKPHHKPKHRPGKAFIEESRPRDAVKLNKKSRPRSFTQTKNARHARPRDAARSSIKLNKSRRSLIQKEQLENTEENKEQLENKEENKDQKPHGHKKPHRPKAFIEESKPRDAARSSIKLNKSRKPKSRSFTQTNNARHARPRDAARSNIKLNKSRKPRSFMQSSNARHARPQHAARSNIKLNKSRKPKSRSFMQSNKARSNRANRRGNPTASLSTSQVTAAPTPSFATALPVTPATGVVTAPSA